MEKLDMHSLKNSYLTLALWEIFQSIVKTLTLLDRFDISDRFDARFLAIIGDAARLTILLKPIALWKVLLIFRTYKKEFLSIENKFYH